MHSWSFRFHNRYSLCLQPYSTASHKKTTNPPPVLNQGKQTIPQMLHCYTHTKLTSFYYCTQAYKCLVFRKQRTQDNWWKKIIQSFYAKFHGLCTSQLQEEEWMWKKKRGEGGRRNYHFYEIYVSLIRVFWPINSHIKDGSLALKIFYRTLICFSLLYILILNEQLESSLSYLWLSLKFPYHVPCANEITESQHYIITTEW